jgi:signal transduction histidine kinase
VDVNSILYDLQDLYEPLIEEKGQSLEVEIGKPMVIQADRDMLFQAFANLLDNAIKYTPEGGQIAIKSYQEGRAWHIEIADNGPGIPEREYDNVTQRFYRLDQSRTTPGSGLGLALVHAVLKLHKLELSFVDNDPGLRVRISVDRPILDTVKKKRRDRELVLEQGEAIDDSAVRLAANSVY